MINLKEIWKLKSLTKANSPLIHCITNPISINGCANIVLATGARPIMAEHPKEVESITKTSQALAVNLGNITDARLISMELSGKIAFDNNIPRIIDLVGVGCSPLRLDFSKDFIKSYKPNIIKGNMSEIKAFLGIEASPIGIDVGEEDEIDKSNLEDSIHIGRSLARKTNSTVLISGKKDIITDGIDTYIVDNGTSMLSEITGTGCMLNTLIASFMPSRKYTESALLGVLLMTIAGELSIDSKGTGSFMVNLLDNIYSLDYDTLERLARYDVYR